MRLEARALKRSASTATCALRSGDAKGEAKG